MKKLNRQGGFTLIEMLVTAGIIAVFAILVIPRITSIFQSNNQVLASGEIQTMIRGAHRYRSARGGVYTGIEPFALNQYGAGPYGSEGATTASDENIYGLDIGITESGTTDATLTYNFPTQEECEAVQDSIEGGGPQAEIDVRLAQAGIDSLADCTPAGVLVVEIE